MYLKLMFSRKLYFGASKLCSTKESRAANDLNLETMKLSIEKVFRINSVEMCFQQIEILFFPTIYNFFKFQRTHQLLWKLLLDKKPTEPFFGKF